MRPPRRTQESLRAARSTCPCQLPFRDALGHTERRECGAPVQVQVTSACFHSHIFTRELCERCFELIWRDPQIVCHACKTTGEDGVPVRLLDVKPIR